MKLDTITMTRNAALDAYLTYKEKVGPLSAEDEMIARGYRQLAMGRNVLALTPTMKSAGLDNHGYPRLAVARADATAVNLLLRKTGSASFLSISEANRRKNVPSWRAERDQYLSSKGGELEFPVGTFSGRLPEMGVNGNVTVKAMAPNIPPAHRPRRGLHLYHLLWEAEEWTVVPTPPRDPALLKRIGGDLYAVLAVWDLTPLERAVLAGTRRS